MRSQYEQDEISLIDLVSVLIKRKRTIIKVFCVITALAVFLAFVPFFQKEKEFEAVSGISILYKYKTPEDPEQIGEGYVYYQDRMQSIMVPTIRGYAQSLTLLRNVIKDLELVNHENKPLKARELSEKIKIENQENSNVIRIVVKYPDEKKAVAIANLIPKKLIEMSRNNSDLKDSNILIIDEAIANDEDSSGGKLLTLAIGMVLGLMLGVFSAFAKEYMNKKVGSVRDVAVIGFDTELEKTGPASINTAENILILSNLSDSKKIVIAAEKDTAIKVTEIYHSIFNGCAQKTRIINYTDHIFTDSSNVTVENKSDERQHSILSNISPYRNNELKDQGMEISIMYIYDDRYPVIAKQSEKAFLIVEQEKTDKKSLKTFANLSSKYDLNISVIYLS